MWQKSATMSMVVLPGTNGRKKHSSRTFSTAVIGSITSVPIAWMSLEEMNRGLRTTRIPGSRTHDRHWLVDNYDHCENVEDVCQPERLSLQSSRQSCRTMTSISGILQVGSRSFASPTVQNQAWLSPVTSRELSKDSWELSSAIGCLC